MRENNKRHCVYIHRLVATQEVICVGHGIEGRAGRWSSRNKGWNNITKDNPWYYTIAKNFMSKEDAEKLEVELINIYNPVGNTIKRP